MHRAGVFLAVAAMAAGAAAPARATLFDYSFTMTSGSVTGTVSGTIDLPFVSGGSGSGAADLVTIDSAPAALLPLPQPNPVTSWNVQGANDFTVTGGVITAYQFDALTGAGGILDDELCFNNGATVNTAFRNCSQNLNFLGSANGFGRNQAGAAGITFASAVPEPATIALLATAILGCAISRRRGVR